MLRYGAQVHLLTAGVSRAVDVALYCRYVDEPFSSYRFVKLLGALPGDLFAILMFCFLFFIMFV